MSLNHHYGTASNAKLATCHNEIDRVMRKAIQMTPDWIDLPIVWGYRNKTEQNGLDPRVTNARWPESYHNAEDEAGNPCSDAVDFAPIINGKIPWNDTAIFCYVAGIIYAAAVLENVQLTWGNDFDNDGDTKDQTLADIGHFQRRHASPRPSS